MDWIKTSEKLPPIGEHVLTCREIPKDEWEDQKKPEYLMDIMSLHKRVKKTGREVWITWRSLDFVHSTEENNRPQYWMPFLNPPDK